MYYDYVYQIYFWLFVFSIILFIVFIAVVETNSSFTSGNALPFWVWLIFLFFLIFLFVSIILYYYYRSKCVDDCVEEVPCYRLEQLCGMQMPEPIETIEDVYVKEPCKPKCNTGCKKSKYRELYEEDVIPFEMLNPFV